MGDPEIVATNHGYACRYTPTIMSGPVFRWSPATDARCRFEVSASRDGVMIDGPGPLMGHAALIAFINLIRLAEFVSQQLAGGADPAELIRATIKAQKETR